MTTIKEAVEEIIRFRDERDWKQFHNAKDLALALSIESAELNELFLWKDASGADPEKLREELADVLMYAFLLAENQGLDILQILSDKLKKNGLRYPVDKARGSAKKYDQL